MEENSRSLFSFLKFISLLGLTVHHLRSIWKNKDDLEISSTSSATQKMFVSQYASIHCKCATFFHIATNNNVYIYCNNSTGFEHMYVLVMYTIFSSFFSSVRDRKIWLQFHSYYTIRRDRDAYIRNNLRRVNLS